MDYDVELGFGTNHTITLPDGLTDEEIVSQFKDAVLDILNTNYRYFGEKTNWEWVEEGKEGEI